jgi:hypothetical protein
MLLTRGRRAAEPAGYVNEACLRRLNTSRNNTSHPRRKPSHLARRNVWKPGTPRWSARPLCAMWGLFWTS